MTRDSFPIATGVGNPRREGCPRLAMLGCIDHFTSGSGCMDSMTGSTDNKNTVMTRLICAIALLVMISGCRPQVIRPANEDVIMPLHVGNRWEAKTINESILHNDRGWNTNSDGWEEIWITNDTVIEGKQWFLTSKGTMLAYTSNGIEGTDQALSPYNYMLRMPEHVGDTVRVDRYTRKDNMGKTQQVICIGIVADLDTLVSVPAGLFRCYMVRMGVEGGLLREMPLREGTLITTFYARGIGKVKEVWDSGYLIGVSRFTWELTEYRVN
jgi:hypothetical protein